MNQISLTGGTITWNIDAITYDENGYADYTDEPSADLLPGSAYDLNFHTDWQDPHFINVRAWVDYNQNGQFDDEEEIGYINSGMASSGEDTFNLSSIII
ncbi:GEVED domain-containing protein [Avrilella dinanensis]|uniref:GEVED domain-containing protein n=1 Tax=Avrilella dinanensis TaxID=2008672 RepID=UPI0030C66C2A